MIYVLGDSYCWGYNFILEQRPNRNQLLFSHLLGKKLQLDYKNYSIAGSSNYRLVRLINWLDIKQDDIVIIGWSNHRRIEIGVPKDRIMPNDTILDTHKLDTLDNLDINKAFQVIEKTDNVYTRQIYSQLMKKFKDLSSPSCKKFVEAYFSYACDETYLEQMFKILVDSTVHKLRRTGCRFLMFTAWDISLKDTKSLDIPEYLFHNTNMVDELRYKNSKLKQKDLEDTKYWSIEEHEKVSEILYNALRDKYDIQ